MRTALILVGSLVLATASYAQDARPWAEKLFLETGCETTRDFKSVAHGAQLFHKFTYRNIYKVPLEVTITRISCGCVTATSSTKSIPPGETGSIDLTLNARMFTGARAVNLYVQFSHPMYYSTAELKVSAFSRTDVVFNPGHVQFGPVAQGQPTTREIEVDYAGTLDWTISDIMVNNLPVEAKAERKASQQKGQVGYKLQVTLKSEAPAGLLKGEIYLRTNDPASPLVPVMVEANVQPAVSVTPAALRATVKPKEERTLYLVVRGIKDFRVLSVEGQGEGISIGTVLPDAASTNHRLAVKVKRDLPGDFKSTLQIKTSAQNTPLTVVVEGTAN